MCALMGSGGSWLIAKEPAKASLEKIRYARAHERRDEVLATCIRLLIGGRGLFRELLEDPDPANQGEFSRKALEVSTAFNELSNYGRRFL